jgi:hypothetical protein
MPASTKNSLANFQASNTFFLISFCLINLLAYTLLLSSIGFLTGFTISYWQFPMACVLSFSTNFYIARNVFGLRKKLQIFKISAGILGLIICLIILSDLFYDISFDGQWYHQETIFRLGNEWNPVFNKIALPANETTSNGHEVWCSGIDDLTTNSPVSEKPVVNLKYLNINHFPKGIEIIGASIYKLNNHIEAGKAVNGIFLCASFFLVLSSLYKIDHISKPKKWLLAGLISFNPITLTQLLSFCVDGVMACALVCIIIASCLLFRQTNKHLLWLLGSLIVLTCNIKFTSLAFTGIFCSSLLIALIITKKWIQFQSVLFVCLVSSIAGIFCCGFNPYLTNFVRDHNAFYGIKETEKEILVTTPPILRDLNSFEKLFISLASHTDSYPANDKSIAEMIKIPFTVNKNELINANDPEVKLSAFGPFFSGALLIAFSIFLILLIRFNRSAIFKQALFVLLIISITILIMPYSWWGRFVPQTWLLPISILCISEYFYFKYDKILKGALYLSLGLNVAWAALAIIFNLFISSHIKYQMSQLKSLRQPITVEYCSYRSFKSNRLRFYEYQIPIIERKVTGKYIYNVIHSNTRFETAVPLPSLNKPILIQFSEKFKAE